MTEQLDDRARDKRNRILDAARFLVLRNGLRGTTMEAIARQAHIAKPTLYAHFSDKDAVFTGIVEGLMRDMFAAYDSGMQTEGGVAQRIGKALAGKYGAAARLLDGSPHADELYSAHTRTADKFRDHDLRVRAEIAAALAEAGVAEPAELTEMLLAAAGGIARTAGSEARVRSWIEQLCERLIGSGR
ncbi:helix-turn-helix domain-containing protein [Devosia sp.]|uniref:TetR/AcrR family transcriptional regulator n=1 Tax=Devosia sp. TaxID=1871048 RepID=UPI0032657B25